MNRSKKSKYVKKSILLIINILDISYIVLKLHIIMIILNTN